MHSLVHKLLLSSKISDRVKVRGENESHHLHPHTTFHWIRVPHFFRFFKETQENREVCPLTLKKRRSFPCFFHYKLALTLTQQTGNPHPWKSVDEGCCRSGQVITDQLHNEKETETMITGAGISNLCPAVAKTYYRSYPNSCGSSFTSCEGIMYVLCPLEEVYVWSQVSDFIILMTTHLKTSNHTPPIVPHPNKRIKVVDNRLLCRK